MDHNHQIVSLLSALLPLSTIVSSPWYQSYVPTSVVRMQARMKQGCMNISHFIAGACSLVLGTLSFCDQVLDTASASSPLRYLIFSGCQMALSCTYLYLVLVLSDYLRLIVILLSIQEISWLLTEVIRI